MKRTVWGILLILLLAFRGHCSDSLAYIVRKNTFYFELGSRGYHYSVNYDRIIYQGKRLSYSARIGGSVKSSDLFIPVGLNIFTHGLCHHFQFGLGLTPDIHNFIDLNREERGRVDAYLFVVPSVGYRYQKVSGGIFFSSGFSPMIFLDPPSNGIWDHPPKLIPSVNAALGWSF